MLDLFDLTQLPPELGDFLREAGSPVEALNRLPAFVEKALQREGVKNEPVVKGIVMEGAQLVGAVFVGEGSVVHPCAVLEGPVYVGKNVKISAHALVRDGSYLADDGVVGHGADIKNTLAMPGAKIQIHTFAGDSVLGRGARVASGAILSNRKFNQSHIKIDLGEGPVDSGRDFLGAIIGDQARVGANGVLSPGTVVGAYTWVGSGCVVQGTLPPDSLVTIAQTLDIRPKNRVELKSGQGEYYNL